MVKKYRKNALSLREYWWGPDSKKARLRQSIRGEEFKKIYPVDQRL